MFLDRDNSRSTMNALTEICYNNIPAADGKSVR